MSSCFFSSRLKMRISRRSEARKRRRTALPNEPVPPVISRVLSLNMADLLRRAHRAQAIPDFDHRMMAFCTPSARKARAPSSIMDMRDL